MYQEVLESCKPGASIIPVIVCSDQTQLTQFGNKKAYPFYVTIGNLPKEIRRKPSRCGWILLSYLPTTKLKLVSNKEARRRMIINIFHSCLQHILHPLVDAGVHGIAMSDGMGTICRVHPLLAVYIGDYPEQVLVTGIKTGECPKCDVSRKELGNIPQEPSKARDILSVHDALCKFDTGSYREFVDACKAVRIKPIAKPFWHQLPFVDIFQSITPDILHQLLQGVFKHMISWLDQAYGSAEIDARCQRLIPNHHIRIFAGGITGLSRVTGKEHGLMGRVILGVIADLSLPGGYDSARLLRAVRALLDFLYLAELTLISVQHLRLMKKALNTFHENKQIFVDLGIRGDFNIPKLHSCLHYVDSIRRFGTTDNYNTQHTERLHIELAKDAFRATNMRDELPQMTAWLERWEQVQEYTRYIAWRCNNPTSTPSPNPLLPPRRYIKMTKFPSVQSVPIEDVIANYGAQTFYAAFARFVLVWRSNGQIPRHRLEQEILDVHIPFINVSVYHRIRYKEQNSDLPSVDSIHIRPHGKDKKGRVVQGRFDTGLIHSGEANNMAIQGMLIQQLLAKVVLN
jgi:hypothetical protein